MPHPKALRRFTIMACTSWKAEELSALPFSMEPAGSTTQDIRLPDWAGLRSCAHMPLECPSKVVKGERWGVHIFITNVI